MSKPTVSAPSADKPNPSGMADELDVSHYFRRLTAHELTLGDTDHHLEKFAAATR